MKNRNLLIIRILFVSLGVLLVLYFTFRESKSNKYTWQETFESESDQPYGTSFIKQLLASKLPADRFVVNEKKPLTEILDTTVIKKKTDYVLVGQSMFLNNEDLEALVNFVASGNDAFIATNHLPSGLIDQVFVSDCDYEIFIQQEEFSNANLNFFNVHLKSDTGTTYAYHFKGKNLPYYWNSLNPDVFCDSTSAIIPLGYIEPQRVNFFKLPYKQGNLFIHTNPLVFTNYFLTKQEKAKYAAQIFSHLQGESMIWDDFSKLQYIRNNAPQMSPLAYVLQQESLRYAWWMMLAASLLYVFFMAKRKQQVVPVLEEKTNTSLEFISMITALHYENRVPVDIARKKVRYFYHSIRVKYNINTHSLSDSQLKQLSEKSKIDTNDLQHLDFELKKVEQRVYYHEPDLVSLHQALEKFYKQCK